MVTIPIWIILTCFAGMSLTGLTLGLMVAPSFYAWIARKKAEREARG